GQDNHRTQDRVRPALPAHGAKEGIARPIGQQGRRQPQKRAFGQIAPDQGCVCHSLGPPIHLTTAQNTSAPAAIANAVDTASATATANPSLRNCPRCAITPTPAGTKNSDRCPRIPFTT